MDISGLNIANTDVHCAVLASATGEKFYWPGKYRCCELVWKIGLSSENKLLKACCCIVSVTVNCGI